MTVQTIPINAEPSQTMSVTLGGQNCKISIYLLGSLLYMDMFVNGIPIFTGVICRDRNLMVRDQYLGFVGDLAFIDTMGASDPVYTGLGDQYKLVYIA